MGRNVIYLVNEGFDVIVVDLFVEGINWVKERVLVKGVEIYFICDLIFNLEV